MDVNWWHAGKMLWTMNPPGDSRNPDPFSQQQSVDTRRQHACTQCPAQNWSKYSGQDVSISDKVCLLQVIRLVENCVLISQINASELQESLSKYVTVFKARGPSLMYKVMTFRNNLCKSQHKQPQHRVQSFHNKMSCVEITAFHKTTAGCKVHKHNYGIFIVAQSFTFSFSQYGDMVVLCSSGLAPMAQASPHTHAHRETCASYGDKPKTWGVGHCICFLSVFEAGKLQMWISP